MWLEEDPKTDGAWERMNLVIMEITSFPDVTVCVQQIAKVLQQGTKHQLENYYKASCIVN